jgi:hypothetical protein
VLSSTARASIAADAAILLSRLETSGLTAARSTKSVAEMAWHAWSRCRGGGGSAALRHLLLRVAVTRCTDTSAMFASMTAALGVADDDDDEAVALTKAVGFLLTRSTSNVQSLMDAVRSRLQQNPESAVWLRVLRTVVTHVGASDRVARDVCATLIADALLKTGSAASAWQIASAALSAGMMASAGAAVARARSHVGTEQLTAPVAAWIDAIQRICDVESALDVATKTEMVRVDVAARVAAMAAALRVTWHAHADTLDRLRAVVGRCASPNFLLQRRWIAVSCCCCVVQFSTPYLK